MKGVQIGMETKLTDKDIIKALECCASVDDGCLTDCPLYDGDDSCFSTLLKPILDIINRLQAENESLEKKIQHLFEEGMGNKAYLCEIIKVDTMVQTLKWLQAHNYISISPEERQNLVKEMVGEE